MLNPYHEKIDIAQILDLQNAQYQNLLYLQEEVAASTTEEPTVNITSLGHFMCLAFTIGYTTLSDETTDTGICPFTFQLVDASNDRSLFDSQIPAVLLASPGRLKSLTGAIDADTVGQPLRLMYPFIYTFGKDSGIRVRITNTVAFANTFYMVFHGIRILSRG